MSSPKPQTGPAKPPTGSPKPAVPAKPAEYWNDTALKLVKGDIDTKYATANKKTATAPLNYVSDMQKDLVELGYLPTGADDGSFGAGTERVLKRFQRHVQRSFRMLNKLKVDTVAGTSTATGICDPATAKDIRAWIDKTYRLPFSLYKMADIDGGKMRDDIGKLWKAAVDDAATKGATLASPYGDTWRNPSAGFTSTGGNSKTSLHYTGRAVDINQEFAGGKDQRYYIQKETEDGKVYWRIWCKTDDATQGTKVEKKTKKHYVFWKNTGETDMPAGNYVDLTQLLEDSSFSRIPAQTGWESSSKKQEWWHFHYAVDLQETFLDEMLLLGYTEKQLKGWGWTEADLDKKPG